MTGSLCLVHSWLNEKGDHPMHPNCAAVNEILQAAGVPVGSAAR